MSSLDGASIPAELACAICSGSWRVPRNRRVVSRSTAAAVFARIWRRFLAARWACGTLPADQLRPPRRQLVTLMAQYQADNNKLPLMRTARCDPMSHL